MNYTFKLSRCLARVRAASVVAASLFTLACAAHGPNEPSSSTDTATKPADTSAITITAPSPTLQAVVLTPATVSLQSGVTQQFGVSGRMSDGSTTSVNATYSATGGTIASDGRYTAGSVAGSYRVIATQTGGTLADTSTVTITTPSTPPPHASCARTVNASTVSGLTSALSQAVAGDCILLTAGTYALGSNLSIARSGSASAPIIVQGAGSSTIIDVNQKILSLNASYVHLRRLRLTNFPGMGLWLHGATGVVIDSVEIDHSGHELMALKDGSHHNVIKNSWFHDSGMLVPYFGEGIYVGNWGGPGFPLDFGVTDNQILNNRFGPNIRSESIDLKEGANRTVIRGNIFDGTGTSNGMAYGSGSLIASYGSQVTIDGNTFKYGRPQGVAFYAPSSGTMAGNVLSNNHVDLQNILGLSGTFYAFDMTFATSHPSSVLLRCNNTVVNGLLANMPCIS